jgi:hypothetical protein
MMRVNHAIKHRVLIARRNQAPARSCTGNSARAVLSKVSRFGHRIEHAFATEVRDGGACGASIRPFRFHFSAPRRNTPAGVRGSMARHGVWIGLCILAQRSPSFGDRRDFPVARSGPERASPRRRREMLLGDLIISASSAQKAVATPTPPFVIYLHSDPHRHGIADPLVKPPESV